MVRLVYNGQTVYAITSYLSNEVIEVEKTDIVNGMVFTAVNDNVTAKMEVNLRAQPTTDSDVVGKLTSGNALQKVKMAGRGSIITAPPYMQSQVILQPMHRKLRMIKPQATTLQSPSTV